jgi:RNA polymerase sigma factor FliA
VDSGDREARIRELLPLVKKIARRVGRFVPCDYDDLVGDGCVGLVRAVDNYDPARGPLTAYARKIVLGAMLNGIRRMDWVPERARRTHRAGESERYRLAGERGSVPSTQEIEAQKPGFRAAQDHVANGVPLSLDRRLPEGVQPPEDSRWDPAVLVSDRSEREWVRTVVDGLPWRERSVMREHYFGELSLREVGRKMGFSAQRASQLHKVAIRRLRKRVDAAAS